jgi:hypothetical protein
MTVKQLIEQLKKYPEDMEVITEGCDCYGDSNKLELIDMAKMRNDPPKWEVIIKRGED